MGILGRLWPPSVSKMERAGDVEGLVTALAYPHDRRVRQLAAAALGTIGDARAVEPLIAALEDSSLDVRVAAAASLRRLADPRAVPALSTLLDSVLTEWDRWMAELREERHLQELRAGGKVSYEPEKDVAEVEPRVRSLYQSALHLAAEAGGPFAPDLVMRIFEERDDFDARCVKALHELQAVAQLARVAQDERAVAALSLLGDFADDERAWSVLVDAFRVSTTCERRLYAAEGLRRAPHPEKLSLLTAALRRELGRKDEGAWLGYDSHGLHRSSEVILTLVEALGELRDPGAVSLLAELLHARDGRIGAEQRQAIMLAVVSALGRTRGQAAIEALAKASDHPDTEVAVTAVRTLDECAGGRAVELLSLVLARASLPVAREAAALLAKHAQHDDAAVDALTTVLSHVDAHKVDAAAAALDELPAERLPETVRGALLGACYRSPRAITLVLRLVHPAALRRIVESTKRFTASEDPAFDPFAWLDGVVRPRLKDILGQVAGELSQDDLVFFAELPDSTTSYRTDELLEAGDSDLGVEPTWAYRIKDVSWTGICQLARAELDRRAGESASG
ncbi:hypothetical protein GCM10012275_16010 [Longimycelium tulufanense]|uniref:HEAT repeat domain-containing protein n=1 Tax=Longimycelium tulufanense TaxID=907463 RepID=A0A8J3FUS1_9PSEU|nr:HEAT repeat domain-containing protein [Longimycelium tulufanense]GGM45788.1 hypothetical protein GCM10012275_16010 [Longimycelium tulufanense]